MYYNNIIAATKVKSQPPADKLYIIVELCKVVWTADENYGKL